MKQKIYKIFFLLSVSAVVLLLKSDVSNGCSDGPNPDTYYTIFEPSLFNLPLLKPFFLSEEKFFPYEETSSLGEKTDNLKEWLVYFKNTPTIDDIDDIIYSAKKEDIQNIAGCLKKGEDFLLSRKYIVNTLICYLKNQNYSKVFDYLLYTRECDPYIAVKDDWENYKRDTSGMAKLIKLGQERYDGCKDNFLKYRYAFQVIRLLHYSYHYEEAVRLYDKYFGAKKNSLIKYWSLEHKAGCLYKLGDYAQSNYEFAQVFDKCPGRRLSCSASFKSFSDSINKISLSLCKNTDEKIAFIFLNSYKNEYVNIISMEEIYKLNPKSQYLELLLEREITKLERETLPPTYDNLINRDQYFKYNLSDSYNQFSAIVSKIARENKTNHSYLWNFAAGYIAALNHESNKAEEFFVRAKKICPKEDLTFINRIKIVQIISKVDGLVKIDTSIEAELYDDLNWLRNNKSLEKLKSQEAFYYIMSMLGDKYYLQKDSAKANLCMGTRVIEDSWGHTTPALGYNLKKNYNIEPLQKIYDFVTSDNLSQYEKFLIHNYTVNASQIREMIATKFILHHDFEEAQQLISDPRWFPDSPVGDLDKLLADPFIIHINDCHDCDFANLKEKIYDKRNFVNRMIELENLVKDDSVNMSKYFFLLANGYYNITYYGNMRDAVAYKSNLPFMGYEINESLGNEFLDCSTAREYYVKAMKTSKDREFAAKCCFMASKCEQNKFYNEAYNDSLLYHNPRKYFEIKNKYRNYFKILKNNYADTKFYQEAIEECKYFAAYVKN